MCGQMHRGQKSEEHRLETLRETEVLVIGAGPAGIAAACSAAECGRRTIVLDDNPLPGGQIWRGKEDPNATKWLSRAQRAGVQMIHEALVFAAMMNDTRVVMAETPDGLCAVRSPCIILATGARERFLPFPGWTLPGVTGAGGLQALVKGGLSIEGKRVVVAGSGALLPAVAAYLHEHGANVRLVAEQTSWLQLIAFGASLVLRPSVAMQGLGLIPQLLGIPYEAGCMVTAAHGEAKLISVTLRHGSRTWQVDCDYLACGYNLVPNLELPVLLGCAIANGYAAVDEWQESSLPGVYCAGELTGIGGVDRSLIEGQIAGYAAAGKQGKPKAQALWPQRQALCAYAERLDRAFALRDDLKALATPETIVCRCEDVRRAHLDALAPGSWRMAKLHTRCGMGACQGRICGPAMSFIHDWPMESTVSTRPPLFPVRMETLTAAGLTERTAEKTGEVNR